MDFVWHYVGDFKFISRCPYMRRMPNGFYCPCGKCLYCRTKLARDLAFRCEEEAFDKHVYNVLITYDDQHLPYRANDKGALEVTLNKVHFQDFMKRLREWFRKEYGTQLRYLCVGEYGGKKGRPHYHMILFTDNDLRNPKKDRNEKGQREDYYFISQVLTEKWRKGACDVEPMNNVGGSIVYMVQYLIANNKDTDKHIEKPFKLMSRGKGLGYKFLERAQSFVNYSRKTNQIMFNNNGKRIAIPRYYQRKYFDESQLQTRADNYFNVGLEYYSYLKKVSYERGEDFNYTVEQWRQQQQRESERRYRQNKIHDNNRSAGRVFARIAKSGKG